MQFRNPKPFKDGELIFNQYRTVDLLMLISGCALSLVLLYTSVSILPQGTIMMIGVVIAMLPAGLGLVLTGKHHGFHNFYEFIKIASRFYRHTKRKYMWEGVILDEEPEERIETTSSND